MTKRKSLIVGGSSGVGLAIAKVLSKTNDVIILDKNNLDDDMGICKFVQFDLLSSDYSVFDQFGEIDDLIITAGFGRLSLFDGLEEQEIINQLTVNTISPIRIVKKFYNQIQSKKDFNCAIMVSIAGFMTSPFFSVYGASKAALKIFIESVNVELTKNGTQNRILNVSPGSIKGTRFSNGENDLKLTIPLAEEIVRRMYAKEDLWIPQYEEVFKQVLERYHNDFRQEGMHSYEYKLNSGRIKVSKDISKQ